MVTTFLVPQNNAVSTLAALLSLGAPSLTLAAGGGALFPSTFPFHITIEDEIIKVDARTADVLSSLTRAQEGTSEASHAATVAVQLRVTAQAVSDLNSAVNTLEAVTHPVAHSLVSHSTRPHSALSDAPASAHHVKYADADAIAAVPFQSYISFGAEPITGQSYVPTSNEYTVFAAAVIVESA